MSITNLLLDVYNCSICFEPMKTAVSLNPCGHELDEGCANVVLKSRKACPICLVVVDSFRPAYTTRQAVEVLFQNMQHPEINIHVNRLDKQVLSYKITSDEKGINLFKRIFIDTGIHPKNIKLVYNNKLVSLFSQHLSEYVPSSEVNVNFYMTVRLGHWTETARDYPAIFQEAAVEVGSKRNQLQDRFEFLYEQAVTQAMNS